MTTHKTSDYKIAFNGRPFLVPILIASLVGVVTGLTAVGYIKVIDLFTAWFSLAGNHAGRYALILTPAIGGLLVGLWIFKIIPQAQGQGVPEVLKALTLKNSRIHPLVIPGKMIGTALSLGSGASVGREGPIVQIGAAIGSNIGRLFKSAELRSRNLIACGTAAGIATVFNAPITGVMYSLEMILKDFGAKALGTVVISAVASSIICQIFLGNSPAFKTPSFILASPWEIFPYLLIGILSGITALLFNQVLHRSGSLMKRITCPLWLKPAFGGLLIGLIAFYVPQVLGTGFEMIEKILHGQIFSWQLLTLLLFLKIISSSVSLTSGNPGGLFGPTLFIGAMLGGVMGQLFSHHMPFPTEDHGAYALAAMASVFAGSAHAPITAIFLALELTGNYHLVLPVMSSVVIATSISQFFCKESLEAVELREHGADIHHWEDVKVLEGLTVQDAFSKNFEIIPADLPALEAAKKIVSSKDKVLFVLDSSKKIHGMITREHLDEILIEKDLRGIIAHDLTVPLPAFCHPHDTLTEASRIMLGQDLRYLPVVNDLNPDKIDGVLSAEGIFTAYTRVAAKRGN